MSIAEVVHSAGWWMPIGLLVAVAVFVARRRRSPLRRLSDSHSRRPPWTPDLIALRRRIALLAATNPRRLTVLAAATAAAVGLLIGGPVAAIMLAVYSILAVRAALRWSARRAAADARSRSFDDLCALAGQLRAGLPPPMSGLVPATVRDEGLAAPTTTAPGVMAGGGVRLKVAEPTTTLKPLGRPGKTWSGWGPQSAADAMSTSPGHAEAGPALKSGRGAARSRRAEAADRAVRRSAVGNEAEAPTEAGDARIADLTAAVWRLAERTGAPAAELVERIEADARAADRAGASAAAQAAGAQATAMLLAALPLGGIGLGYSIGTDPLEILLHTRAGAACAIGAVLLQCAGLWWADRLVSGVAR